MKFSFVIFLILCYHEAHAQQYFNNRYSVHAANSQFNSVVAKNHRYYCTGTAFDSSFLPGYASGGTGYGVKFCILDSVGNLILDTIFQSPFTNQYYALNPSLQAIDSNQFLLALSNDIDYAAGATYTLLLRFDSNGQVLQQYPFPKLECIDSGGWTAEDMRQTETGEWLVLSSIACANFSYPGRMQGDIMLTKLNRNFQVIWTKKYGDPMLDDWPKRIRTIKNGYLIASCNSNDQLVSTGKHYRAELIKIDTAGNLVWDWQSDTSRQFGLIYDAIQTKDGGYVYSGIGWGNEEITGGGWSFIYSKGWIEKLDSNRNSKWFDTAGIPESTWYPLRNIFELNDSSIVVGGELLGGLNTDTTNLALTYAYLAKYRSNGTPLWKRKYSYQNDSLLGHIYDIKQSWDGGFVLCGSSDDTYHLYDSGAHYRGWALKVDGNGCMSLTDTQCMTTAVPMATKTNWGKVEVYPNPAKHTINIETSAPPGYVYELTLMNMPGSVMAAKKLTGRKDSLDVSMLPEGLYVYKVTCNGVNVGVGKVVKID